MHSLFKLIPVRVQYPTTKLLFRQCRWKTNRKLMNVYESNHRRSHR